MCILVPVGILKTRILKIMPKDKIEVKGSRITFEDKPALIAAEIKKGYNVLVLRDKNGFTAWSGWKRR